MKTLIATVALATLIAAPAFAQAPATSGNTVIFNGKVIGTDPDANVRSQLQRDWEWQGRPRPWMSGH